MLGQTSKVSKEDFDKVFYEIPNTDVLKLQNKNEVRFFMLNVQNDKYSYFEMFKILKQNLGRYALSRKEFASDPEMAISKAISRFHEVKNAGNGAGGELGEILLYLFLEVVLGAPKLLSKMELKGTQNQYNYNSDAVHFYKYSSESGTHNQVILCESKLIGDISTAINKAFESLCTSLERRDYDFSLISTEIFKETMSEDDAKQIINEILPNVSEDIKNDTIKETAAGMFLGYNEPVIPSGDSIQTRKQVISSISSTIPSIIAKLNEKIVEHKMSGMSFYIYFLPFNDVSNDRSKIMEQLFVKSAFEEQL